MSRWFRFYDDAINDPKILKLSDKLHRIWIGILCVASKNDGQLPALEDMALMIRMKPEKIEEAIKSLITAGLIDGDGPILSPHNWDKRQFKSDVSTERVKRFRNGKGNVSETPPETETETETEAYTEKKEEGAFAPPARSSKKDRKRASPLPADFQPDWPAATAVGLSRNEAEREHLKFKNHAEANGRTCVNWQAAWRNWCITAAGYLKKPQKQTGPPVAMTITPKSRSWNAWKAYFRDNGMNGRAAIMDKCAGEDRPFTVESEWPPGFEISDAA